MLKEKKMGTNTNDVKYSHLVAWTCQGITSSTIIQTGSRGFYDDDISDIKEKIRPDVIEKLKNWKRLSQKGAEFFSELRMIEILAFSHFDYHE